MKIVLIIFLGLLTACSNPSRLRDEYLPFYVTGRLQHAEKPIKLAICEDMPQNQFTQSKNSVWYLLNLATIQFAKGAVEESIKNYNLASDALDYYAQKSTGDLTGQFLLDDAQSGYTGASFEQSLSKIYFALALLQKGDHSNAEALLRRCQTLNQTNPLGDYLFASLLEKRGDRSNAKILFNKCGKELPEVESNKATLILVCHNGNAPSKYSTIAPASQASLIMLEQFLASYKRPISLSSLPGIPIPAPFRWKGGHPIPTSASIGDQSQCLSPIFNVDQTSIMTMKEEMPKIIARGVARYLIRRSCVYVANERNSTLGSMVDVGCLIANAMTKADTRAWDTLPASIDVARFDVDPGIWPLTVKVGHRTFQKSLTLKSGEIKIINIFNLHPGITLL